MKQTNAPITTPSPTRKADATDYIAKKSDNPTSVFVGMALDMSWRLAIVVLIPIIGGFKLDSHFHSSPLIAITGFAIAIAGTAAVMRQTVRAANNLPVPKKASGR